MTLLNVVWFSHFASLSHAKDPKSLAVAEAGYLSFLVATDEPMSIKKLLQGDRVKSPPSQNLIRYICSAAFSDTERGTFDDRVVRFAVKLKNGHALAIDQDGGVSLDGRSYSLSKRAFGAIVEALAREYPESDEQD